MAQTAARAAIEKGGVDPVALEVGGHVFLTDIFLIVSGDSERQVRAIADAIDDAMVEKGIRPLRREGAAQGRWVLMDYDYCVVHVFNSEDREHYDLERLWADCPKVQLDLPEASLDL
ncbi:ribosome silencing factor [Boudabousia marimammalium]|uniref:Ribosomal silencing factor RsfS n=2 Tax=Boudabousia marimammalium TaxID=156892 RepID=A0A1Q5PRA4_9ACTO|nr:ribosome silencing factor [Boudabousia marimammalium]